MKNTSCSLETPPELLMVSITSNVCPSIPAGGSAFRVTVAVAESSENSVIHEMS